ncbi:MAG: NUDIX domain-containing protein [Candidatus Aenigmatarchaeota archaeon]
MKTKMTYPGVGCAVMLIRGGKVLLGHRHEDPKKADSMLNGAGTWTLPGGKMDFQERPKECARREAKEETGMDVGQVELISVSNDRVEHAHFVTLGFKSTDFRGEPMVMEPDEITQWKWFSIGSTPAKMFPPARKIIENYTGKNLLHEDD